MRAGGAGGRKTRMGPRCEQEIMPEVLEIPAETPENGVIRRDEQGHYLPGQSGNPSGHPKRTWEQQEALEEIRKLAPVAADKIRSMLDDAKVPAVVKARLIEIILERTYGKPEAAIKLSADVQSNEAARARLEAIAARIRLEVD